MFFAYIERELVKGTPLEGILVRQLDCEPSKPNYYESINNHPSTTQVQFTGLRFWRNLLIKYKSHIR